MRLSVVIPARDEQDAIGATIRALSRRLDAARIDHELLVVDDGSTDATPRVVEALSAADPRVRLLANPGPLGFGFAVRAGLERFAGDAVAIVMADGSDDPDDLVAYHGLLCAGYDCAFGSRFMAGGEVRDYPRVKLVANRLVNWSIRVLFGHGYDDTTNAFKAYRREVIASVMPLVSHHFNLTVELPLKAIVRGHSYVVTPVGWRNRRTGASKLQLQEMGSRYAYIVLMVLLEHHLSRGDYRRTGAVAGHHWRGGRPAARVGRPGAHAGRGRPVRRR